MLITVSTCNPSITGHSLQTDTKKCQNVLLHVAGTPLVQLILYGTLEMIKPVKEGRKV